VEKVRNHFAHVSRTSGFDEATVRKLAFRLKAPKYIGDPYDDREDPDTSPKAAFYSGIRTLLYHLTEERRATEKEGRRIEPDDFFPIGSRGW
jgi:hypothetical protein